MRKIWSYLAVGFAFFSAGIVAGVKLMGDQVEINIRKVKNKRVSGEVNTTIPINLDSAKTARQTKREERKLAKKQKNGGA